MKFTVIAAGVAAGAGLALAGAASASADTTATTADTAASGLSSLFGDGSAVPATDPLGFLFNPDSAATKTLNADWTAIHDAYQPTGANPSGDWAGVNLTGVGDNATGAGTDLHPQTGDIADFAKYDDQLFDKLLAGSPASDHDWFNQGLGQLLPDAQAWSSALDTDLLGALDGKISLSDLGTDLFGTNGLFTGGLDELFTGKELDGLFSGMDFSQLGTAFETFGTALFDPSDWGSLGTDLSTIGTDLAGLF